MELEEEYERKKKSKSIITIVLIVVIVVGAMIGIKLYLNKNNNPAKTPDPIVEKTDGDYIYKVRYDFGTECYIYLYKDNVIKTETITEIYETKTDCDCMESTGEFKHDIVDIKFSDQSKEKVIKVLDELYKIAGNKEFNADKLTLTKYQSRVLLAVMLNHEDMITIEDSVKFDEVKEGTNTKMMMSSSTSNETVNKIATFLNDIVYKDFNEINTNNENNYNLKLELAYVGPYSLSFVYKTEKDNKIVDMKGYYFKYTGEVHDFDMGGWKNTFYEGAKNYFMNTDIYKNNKENLKEDWETILIDTIFTTGNWYLGDGKVYFFINSNLLGIEENTIIELEATTTEDF